MPKKVILDPDEVDRVNRVRIARYLGKFPSDVDTMDYSDLMDVLAVMRADARIEQHEAAKARQARTRKR